MSDYLSVFPALAQPHTSTKTSLLMLILPVFFAILPFKKPIHYNCINFHTKELNGRGGTHTPQGIIGGHIFNLAIKKRKDTKKLPDNSIIKCMKVFSVTQKGGLYLALSFVTGSSALLSGDAGYKSPFYI